MPQNTHSDSPTILLRISNETFHIHQPFNDFDLALRSAEAFAGAGFHVAMMSATGRFLMALEERRPRLAV